MYASAVRCTPLDSMPLNELHGPLRALLVCEHIPLSRHAQRRFIGTRGVLAGMRLSVNEALDR